MENIFKNKGNFDKDGYFDLDKKSYQKRDKKIQGNYSSCKGWITIDDQEILLKTIEEDESIFFNPLERDIELYNNILVPELLEMINIKHAKYYLGRNKDKRYIMTPSFLQKGQKIVPGSEIIEDEAKSEIIEEHLKSIEEYLRNKGIQEEKIEEYKNKHLQKLFISKWLGIVDFHTDNWGIIEDKNGNVVEEMPLIDFECLDIDIQSEDFANRLQNGKSDLNAFLKKYKNCPQIKETIEKIKSNINIKGIFQNAYKNTNVMIKDPNLQRYYYEYFNQIIGKMKTQEYGERNR